MAGTWRLSEFQEIFDAIPFLGFFSTRRVLCIFRAGLVSIAPFALSQGLASSDISRLRSVGSVELSPDGHRIAYTIGCAIARPPLRPALDEDVGTQKSARAAERRTPRAARYGRQTESPRFQGSIEDSPAFLSTRDGSGVAFPHPRTEPTALFPVPARNALVA